MCGIVGYVGGRDASKIVFDGLRCLEYRGYDSAGIAVLNDGRLQLRRCVGKLDNLQRLLERKPASGPLGIGHTRWATHGKPSEVNSHPHSDCHGDTVVIHNGIVENFLELKARLMSEGHAFASDTDTECIAHLIESYLARGDGLAEAVARTLGEIEGGNAIVAISRREPDKMVAARLGNAGGVVVGLGEGETFVASDMPAILGHTRRMLFLDNREMAVVTRTGAEITTIDGERVRKQVHEVVWDAVSAAKGGYKHFMLKEISEQAQSLTDTIRGRTQLDPPEVLLDSLNFSPREARALDRIVMVACGTAWHAALVGKFMIEELAKIPVEVDYASEFRYRNPLLTPRTALVAVTQSGETADVLVSMELARQQHIKTIAVVNVVGSQAVRLADGLIYLRAGPEIGVASTKAFTSMVVALYLLGLYLGRARGHLDADQLLSHLRDVLSIPELVGETLARPVDYRRLANRFHRCRDFLYLGRGIDYPIALEGALKLKEISYIHAEGYPAGEMKHGPIALIDEDMPVVIIATQGPVYSKVVANIEEVKARGGVVIAVATDGDEGIAGKADEVISVPAASPYVSALLAAIPMQLLAYQLAVRLGCDVDQPRNLAKSVTVE
ncbi:MAG: glutamine--fructose-6-phosphate transaminase (isomerizing) [Chloroflexi bacterium]|nr:glutamine--fructose-6-phosphate transaminase (isomerizing) [Chloroflexota bacterium]